MLQTSFSTPQADASRKIVELALEDRLCECCQGFDLEPIWTNEYVARTRTSRYLFRNRNVVCRRCGFAFVSPCPSDADLYGYYADALAHYAGQPPSSDIDARAELIRARVPAGLTGLEIGGNQLTRDSRIRAHFANFTHVEPNSEISAQYARIDDVPSHSTDVLVHYYVLEHARDPKRFLRECHRILRPGGTMICEVPDMKLYPHIMGDYLFWEHLTHFSAVSLARIAGAAGFRLVDLGHRAASNEHGMFAVFGWEDAPLPAPSDLSDATEFLDARASLREGLRLIERFNAMLEATRIEIDNAKQITIWGANGVVQRLLSPPYQLPDRAIVVDDDPRKADFLDGVPVHMPANVRAHIAGSTLVVIATSRLANRIAERARTLAGNEFTPKLRVIDYDLPVAT